MARPLKETVDYFSHDSDASESRTVSILENHYGAEGYSAWFKLLERVSRTRNHVIDCRNGEDVEFLAAKFKMQPERLKEILAKMAELGAIDYDLWQSQIIWCQNLVDRLKDVYDNRKQRLPSKPIVSTDDNRVLTLDNQVINPCNTTKESKVKESKVNKEINKESKMSFADFIEQELRPEFPDMDIEKELKKFNLYWSEGNRKLQRPKTAFRNWLTKAREFKNDATHQSRVGKTPAQYTRPEELLQ